MHLVQCNQRDAEWHRVRSKCITASDFAAALDKSRYQTQHDFILQKQGLLARDDLDWAMAPLHGYNWEYDALEAYANHDGPRAVSRVNGVCFPSPDDMRLGASPDGFVGDDGIVEIKCPVWGKFYRTIPPYQVYQVKGLMGVCGRAWCDHVQWTKDGGMRVTRFHHDPAEWASMQAELLKIHAIVFG